MGKPVSPLWTSIGTSGVLKDVWRWVKEQELLEPSSANLMEHQMLNLCTLQLFLQHALHRPWPSDQSQWSRFQANWPWMGLVLPSHQIPIKPMRSTHIVLWNIYSYLRFIFSQLRRLSELWWRIYYFMLFRRDNFLILQALMASITYYTFPCLEGLPLWNTRGLITALVLHVGVSEPLYYWVHRCFHGQYLFQNYHSLHHRSPVPQPPTGIGIRTVRLQHLLCW